MASRERKVGRWAERVRYSDKENVVVGEREGERVSERERVY